MFNPFLFSDFLISSSSPYQDSGSLISLESEINEKLRYYKRIYQLVLMKWINVNSKLYEYGKWERSDSNWNDPHLKCVNIVCQSHIVPFPCFLCRCLKNGIRIEDIIWNIFFFVLNGFIKHQGESQFHFYVTHAWTFLFSMFLIYISLSSLQKRKCLPCPEEEKMRNFKCKEDKEKKKKRLRMNKEKENWSEMMWILK